MRAQQGPSEEREKDPRDFIKPPYLLPSVGIPKSRRPQPQLVLGGNKVRQIRIPVLQSDCLDLALAPAHG